MNISMINSLVGMSTLQNKIDSIANNLSNINTTGYKSREVYFHEILTNRLTQPEQFNLAGRNTALGLDIGYGAKTSSTFGAFSQGPQIDTGIATDLMLTGDNIFFTILPANGDGLNDPSQYRYTRDGHFQLDAGRYLVTDNGDFVLDTDGEPIYVPEGAAFNVDKHGNVIVQYPNGEVEELNALKVTKVLYPESLEAVGKNMFRIPEELLAAEIGITDEQFALTNSSEGFQVIQGSLEGSNVDLAKEMVQLNEAQRAYQFLSRGLSISDQMLGIASKLRG